MRETVTSIGELVAYALLTAGLVVGLGVTAGLMISGAVLLGILSFWFGEK